MIRKATPADVPAIGETYTQLLTHEQAHGGHSNWQLGVYPTEAFAAEHVDKMYVLEEEGHIAASMLLNQEQAAEYATIPWQYPAEDKDVLVIHTLCIPPALAGRGYGRKMVAFAKEEARAQGCQVMRIDTYAYNEPAKALYQKQGFRIAGYADCLHHGLIQEKLVYLECSLTEESF